TSGSFRLEGGSITGSTIKTANSGSRVEITSNGLRQYDSAGNASLVLDSGIAEVRNALSVSQAGVIQLLGSADGPGEGENVSMFLGRDRFGRAAIMGEDLTDGAFQGSIAWEDGAVRTGMVFEGPHRNQEDNYPLLLLN